MWMRPSWNLLQQLHEWAQIRPAEEWPSQSTESWEKKNHCCEPLSFQVVCYAAIDKALPVANYKAWWQKHNSDWFKQKRNLRFLITKVLGKIGYRYSDNMVRTVLFPTGSSEIALVSICPYGAFAIIAVLGSQAASLLFTIPTTMWSSLLKAPVFSPLTVRFPLCHHHVHQACHGVCS